MSKALDSTLPGTLASVVSYTGNSKPADQSPNVTVGASASTESVTNPDQSVLEDTSMSGTNTPTAPVVTAPAAAPSPGSAEFKQAVASQVSTILQDRDNQIRLTEHITGLVNDAASVRASLTSATAETTTLRSTITARDEEIKALKTEASLTATKLTEANTALTKAQADLTAAQQQVAATKMDAAITARKATIATSKITNQKFIERAIASKDGALLMGDEDFNIMVESLAAPASAPAPATPATETPAPATSTTAAPVTPPVQTVASQQTPPAGQQQAPVPAAPDLSGAAAFTHSVAALANQTRSVNASKFLDFGVGTGN